MKFENEFSGHDVDDRKLFLQTNKNKGNAVRLLKDKNVSDESISQICRIVDDVIIEFEVEEATK